MNLVSAERVSLEYSQATMEVDTARRKLQDIEEGLEDVVLKRFRDDFNSRGGEKYRPSEEKTGCRWHNTLIMYQLKWDI